MRKRVMVVDDDADILSLVSTVLLDAGYDVTTAGNGREAMAALTLATPHLMLLDLTMPGLSGDDLVSQIREAGLAPTTPIVVMTGSPLLDEQVRRMLVSGYLPKPFDLEDLVLCAARYTDSSAALP
ncbi:MAG: response regulator [Chloroflexota bacterium]